MKLKPGQAIPLKTATVTDPLSRRRVERISDNMADTALSYFTREIVAPDNRGVLAASNRTGKWLPYLLDADAKFMRCLSVTPMVAWASPAIGGDRVVYVSEDGRLGFAPLDGGPFQAITVLPRGREYSHVGVSACGRRAFLIYSEPSPPTSKRIRDGSFPSSASEKCAFGPRAVMLYVNLDTGITKGLTGGSGCFAHPMISPADPALMEYCFAAPWQQAQRMWTLRYYEQANHVEVRPLFPQKLGIDAVGHEFFLQDGRIAAIWMRFARVGDPADKPKESFILVADPASGKHRAYRVATMLYNHLHGRDGKVFVSEGISGKEGPKRLDALCRYDAQGAKATSTILCAHGCSWKNQLAHPHAVLCRANRWCWFNSDREGRCNVYRVEMT